MNIRFSRLVVCNHLVVLSCLAVLGFGCARKASPEVTPIPAPPVADIAAAAPPPPPPAPAPGPAPVPEPDIWSRDLDAINAYLRDEGILGDVLFDYDQAELTEDARRRLASGARFMQERPEFVVAIYGHCDERGTSEYNMALGERRATAANEYLTSLQVTAGRLRTASYGKEQPVCREAHEDCWRRNRRAQLVVVERRAG